MKQVFLLYHACCRYLTTVMMMGDDGDDYGDDDYTVPIGHRITEQNMETRETA